MKALRIDVERTPWRLNVAAPFARGELARREMARHHERAPQRDDASSSGGCQRGHRDRTRTPVRAEDNEHHAHNAM
eukprot:3904753-Pyramimonas_sp.AAC.1